MPFRRRQQKGHWLDGTGDKGRGPAICTSFGCQHTGDVTGDTSLLQPGTFAPIADSPHMQGACSSKHLFLHNATREPRVGRGLPAPASRVFLFGASGLGSPPPPQSTQPCGGEQERDTPSHAVLSCPPAARTRDLTPTCRPLAKAGHAAKPKDCVPGKEEGGTRNPVWDINTESRDYTHVGPRRQTLPTGRGGCGACGGRRDLGGMSYSGMLSYRGLNRTFPWMGRWQRDSLLENPA